LILLEKPPIRKILNDSRLFYLRKFQSQFARQNKKESEKAPNKNLKFVWFELIFYIL
jgi:hypothetical protein